MPLTHRFSKSTVYVLVVIFLTVLGATAVNIAYTNRVAQDTNRRWCGVLRVYHEAAAANPAPTTQYGKDILAQLEQLYADFHCDRVPAPGRAEEVAR